MASLLLILGIAVVGIGNHLPRQCGIATFTTDLSGVQHIKPNSMLFSVGAH